MLPLYRLDVRSNIQLLCASPLFNEFLNNTESLTRNMIPDNAQNSKISIIAETVRFHKISAPVNYVKLVFYTVRDYRYVKHAKCTSSSCQYICVLFTLLRIIEPKVYEISSCFFLPFSTFLIKM